MIKNPERMLSAPPYLLFLMGPNGAGKSTFYNTFLKTDPLLEKVPFLNTDIIAMKESGSQAPEQRFQVRAGKEVLRKIDEHLADRKSFIYETTGSGSFPLKLMDRAKKEDFQIATVFIGLSNAQLSHLRVQSRYQNGGHIVPAEDINRRFPRVMEHLPEMIQKSDLTTIFDNSGKVPFKLLCMTHDDQNFMMGSSAWLKKVLDAEKDNLPPQINLYQNLKKQDKTQIAFWLGTQFKSFFER